MVIKMSPSRFSLLYVAAAVATGTVLAVQLGWPYFFFAVVAFFIFLSLEGLYFRLPGALRFLAPIIGLVALFTFIATLMFSAQKLLADEIDQPGQQMEGKASVEDVARIYSLFQAELAQQAATSGASFNQMQWLAAVKACNDELAPAKVTPETMTLLRTCAGQRLLSDLADNAAE
jgi:hypothetical protein